MKLLLDANISWRVCKDVKAHFTECLHVDSIGIKVPASDREIWQFAKNKHQIIVTNDEDFLNLSTLYGFPPKIVLLKMGNQSNKEIAEILIRHKNEIEALHYATDAGVLEIL